MENGSRPLHTSGRHQITTHCGRRQPSGVDAKPGRYRPSHEIDGPKSAGFWRMVRGFWAPEGVAEYIYTETKLLQIKVTRRQNG